MKKIALIAATAAAFAATPALADGPAGLRLEGLVGYDKVSADLGSGVSVSRDGVGFGVNVGYDLPVSSSLSAGLDAEVADSSTELNYTDGTNVYTVSAQRDLYVGARVTAAVSPTVNVYAKAGYTNARLKETLNGLSDSGNGDGVRAGIGAQVTVFGNAYALVEYRYSNYEADVTRNQVLTGLGVRF